MKVNTPTTVTEYLADTEPAVRHLYDGLNSIHAVYGRAREHWNWQRTADADAPSTTDLAKYLELADEYFSLTFAKNTYAGAILQIAYAAIRLYSGNTAVPSKYDHLVSGTAARQFCVGPDRFGIPAGLLVYVGRNQYAHWDDPTPHETSQAVFEALTSAFYDDPTQDLVFDLSNPTLDIYATTILELALGWLAYEDYQTGLRELLL